ncbi:iron ABC transporter permease [Sphingomonas sp.]|uniref:FecCD family ABC transporter permease n=1 Tax=Sphingomonas sp. TaxID=28214 RepID=UPI002BAF24A4|nr:iron ABC transporter permease [Sphingomonas sp.]HWK35488.1 iron ABC transporter permease [Sphingomonas sp.]
MRASIDPDHPLLAAHRRTARRRDAIVAALALACVAALVLDVVTGPASLGVRTVIDGLVRPGSLDPTAHAIIWQIRLPQALVAMLVGAALSLAGAEMQTVLNNPLSDPFTLGVSSAASFGASLAIVLGISIPFVPFDAMTPINAFVLAFAAVLVIQALARAQGGGAQTLVLFGIALVFAFNALTALVQFIASPEALQQLVFWTMGSLSRASWGAVGLLGAVLVAVVPFALLSARQLTALRLGEDRAASTGVDVRRLRFVSLFRVSLLSATAVACVGVVGFVGLVGPHIARLLLGEDHRRFLPGSMLVGALLMSLAASAAKLIVPGASLPVGIVTALIGVPVFLALMMRSGARA